MKNCYVSLIFLSLFLVIAACRSEMKESKTEKATPEPAETAEPKDPHVGGCILSSPAATAPDDLYQVSNIVPTDEYKPFTKKLMVYGITLIGREDISDEFMKKVADTIMEMFPRNETINDKLQKQLLTNLYRYKTVIPFFLGEEHEFTDREKAEWEVTTNRNSICDIIMADVPGQVNEVVEHILHHVTDVGLHYTFPENWGISKTSDIYSAMQEAIDKGHYNIEQYKETDDEVRTRILIQEYAYWIIFTAWNLLEPYAPEAEWTGIKNRDELKAMLPQSYEIFETTIPKVMSAPSIDTLEKFK